MVKNTRKKGRFSISAKNERIKASNLNRLKNNNKLDIDEKRMLSAAKALKPTQSAYDKAGMFRDKRAKRVNKASNAPEFNLTNMLGGMDNKKMSLAPMLKSQSPTGVLSLKKINKNLSNFINKLQSNLNIKNVNINKKDNKITGFDVNKEFQKSSFKFNPKDLTVSSKGWQLNLPKEYIKVNDKLYRAPKIKYTKEYRKKRKDGDTDRDYYYGSYTPVEVFLSEPNKLKKVVKRGTYTKVYNQSEEEDERQRFKEREVYNREVQDYFDTGIMKRKQQWSNFLFELDEDEDEDEWDEDETYKTYLKRDIQFNPTGTKKSYKEWDDYTREEDEEEEEDEYSYNEDRSTFLAREEQYNPMGRLTRRKQYDVFDEEIEEEYGVKTEEEISRRPFLERDEFFADGKRTARYDYDDYLSDSDSSTKNNIIAFTESGKARDVGSVRWYNMNKDKINEQYGGRIYDKPVESDEYEQEYEIGLDSVTFYDPMTGKIIENHDYM